MAQLIVHAGYPKCGSTLLQRHVFPYLVQVRHVPFAGETELYQALALRSFPGGEAGRSAALSRFAHEVAAATYPTLISAEHFIMPAECFRSLEHRTLRYLDGLTIFEQIAELQVPVRVLVVVRRQDDWLRSWYQERVKRFETRSFSKFVLAPENQVLLAVLLYHRMIESLESKFGPRSVHVVPFELMRRDSAAFWHRLRELLPSVSPPIDMPVVRRGMRRETVALRRSGNRLLRRLGRATGGETGLDRFAFGALKKAYALESLFDRLLPPGRLSCDPPDGLMDHFRADNRALSARLGTDLSQFGYCC